MFRCVTYCLHIPGPATHLQILLVYMLQCFAEVMAIHLIESLLLCVCIFVSGSVPHPFTLLALYTAVTWCENVMARVTENAALCQGCSLSVSVIALPSGWLSSSRWELLRRLCSRSPARVAGLCWNGTWTSMIPAWWVCCAWTILPLHHRAATTCLLPTSSLPQTSLQQMRTWK